MDWKAFPEKINEKLKRKPSFRSLSIFCQQLSVLLSSGLPIPEALEVIASEMKEKDFRHDLLKMKKEIETGKNISEAAESVGCFPVFFLEMMATAQETGGISEILTALSDYYSRQEKLRSEILQVTLYPSLVLVLSIVIVIFLLTKVVPIFTEIIESLSGEIPVMTQLMIGFGSVVSKIWILLLPLIVICIMIRKILLKENRVAVKWGRIKLKLPLAGKFLMNHACMQLTQGLALMLKGGVNLPESLVACKGIVGNAGLSAAIEKIYSGVTGGRNLTECMIETGAFPGELCQMVRVGEETGTLTETLEKASDYFRGNFSRQTKMMTTLLEPAILIFVGLMVLVVMLSMMQPIYQVYECYVNMM